MEEEAHCQNNNSCSKQVRFSQVEQVHLIPKEELSVKQKVFGFLESVELSWTIKKDENLKTLIKGQKF